PRGQGDLVAMNPLARMQPANAQEDDKQGSRPKTRWQELLQEHALLRWHTAIDCLSNGKPIPARDDAALVSLISSLGTQGEEAIQIVDRFALGSAAEAFALGEDKTAPGED